MNSKSQLKRLFAQGAPVSSFDVTIQLTFQSAPDPEAVRAMVTQMLRNSSPMLTAFGALAHVTLVHHAGLPKVHADLYGLHRELAEEEVPSFKKWARDNYKPGAPISALWHPVTQSECALINTEASYPVVTPD